MQWDPPTETGGRDDLTYTVTVSPPVQLSATVLTSTSVTVIAQYNVDYTVSVVATNCAGSSTTTDYNFTIGESDVYIIIVFIPRCYNFYCCYVQYMQHIVHCISYSALTTKP